VHLPALHLFGVATLNSAQQLFFIGSIAIVVGIFTYSQKVNTTIGKDIFKISPIEAFIVVVTQGIVLFLFSSVGLHNFLVRYHLPSFPLVPISNVGAVIGALIGVSITKKGQGLQFKALLRIMRAWLITPIFSAVLCYFALFFMQNVFGQEVL